jgi:AAA+ ATPase superfamily predicted ATPase
MRNFSASMAKDFLVSGFKQIKLEPNSDVLEYAIKRLDGVPEWLTLFGVRCRDRNLCSKELVDEVASEAGKLAREEVLKIVALSRRYGVILNSVMKVGEASWSQIKSVVETKEARSVTNHAVSTLIRNLVNMGIICETGGKYAISDALLIEGIRDELLPE